MHALSLSLLALSLLLGPACGQDDEPPRPDPGTSGAGDGDTGPTGVLTEDEFKALHELSDEERPAPAGTMVDVGDMRCYLSLPKGKGPHPGIVVIHEWWGLNEHVRFWADRLAADGYAALAVDLYEGKVATTREDAMRFMRSVEEPEAIRRLKAAHAFLGADERVQAPRTGCVGWCFGGGWSLQLALVEPGLDAAVVYYGRLVTDPTKLKAIEAPLLGVFGNLDPSIPPETVTKFEEALKEAGVAHEILRYDAQHAFANPSGGRYDAKSAEDAWKHVRAFFAKHLAPKPKPDEGEDK